MEQLKVVIIGAASPQWGYILSRDFIVKLSDEAICSRYAPVLVLEDIDGYNLELQAKLAQKVAGLAGGKVAVESTTDQRRAVEGARFVVTTFAQGSLEYMRYDVDIPAEYGIYQPVGDSISGATGAIANEIVAPAAARNAIAIAGANGDGVIPGDDRITKSDRAGARVRNAATVGGGMVVGDGAKVERQFARVIDAAAAGVGCVT